MSISADEVKKLREMTGAGMMDCKKALTETAGDVDKAVDVLRTKGLAGLEKRAGRVTKEGVVESYIHSTGKIGVLVEIDCETDFVARSDDFRSFAHDVAMQIAAAQPQYVTRDQVPEDVLAHERGVFEAQAKESGKPEKVVGKIIDGKMEKLFEAICLLEQPFIKDGDTKVERLLGGLAAKVGENIEIRRFTRFEVGAALAEE